MEIDHIHDLNRGSGTGDVVEARTRASAKRAKHHRCGEKDGTE
jgi:hypothetical protein